MTIILAESEKGRNRACLVGKEDGNEFIWVSSAAQFVHYPQADAFVDFGFNGSFFSPADKPLLINETISPFYELANYPLQTARFCGWPGFTERLSWELAATNSNIGWLEELMNALGKNFELVKDGPGLVAPRILSMVINEACYTLSEGITDANQIDIAMQLGTNYPEGPISWGRRIGGEQIFELLKKLSEGDERYLPHILLKNYLD